MSCVVDKVLGLLLGFLGFDTKRDGRSNTASQISGLLIRVFTGYQQSGFDFNSHNLLSAGKL